MTNEEKILQRLDTLVTSVANLTTKFTGLDTTVVSLTAIVAELPTRAEIPTVEQIREVVKDEVRAEVASQLVPVHVKLDEIHSETRDDNDAMARADAHHDRRLKRIEKQLDLRPLPAQ